MVAWINFSILLFSSLAFLCFYVRSVSPAGRARIIGAKAYRMCYYDRLIAGVFELVITVNFILYTFFPLPTPLPERYPWPWWLSLLIAAVIGIPATILMVMGLRDAGEEAMRPKQEHTMYGGIYKHIRHPQAVGEVFLFPVMAFVASLPILDTFLADLFPHLHHHVLRRGTGFTAALWTSLCRILPTNRGFLAKENSR